MFKTNSTIFDPDLTIICDFGPGGLCAPCVLACAMRACMRHACVMRACVRHACLRAPCVAWPLLSPTFALSFFWPRRLACAMRAPCIAWPLLSPSFSLSSFLFLSSFSLRLLLLTHFGESPVRENLFSPIFWYN